MKINKNIFICALLVVMMLACVSAVSAEDDINADLGAAAADDAIDLSIDDVKESETLEGGSNSGEILAVDEPTVTNSTFFNYFDENGVLNKSISADELKFEGEFSNLGIDTITVDAPIVFSGSNTTIFKNIGFKIISDDVELNGFEIAMNGIDGAAIDINDAEDVTIEDMTINFNSEGLKDAYAIRAINSDYLSLIQNTINFNAGYTNTSEAYIHVVEVRNSNKAIIAKNIIAAQLPALRVNYSAPSGIDQDKPLVVGIQKGEDILFTENEITTTVTGSFGKYPTLDTFMAYGFTDLEISNNTIAQNDFSGVNKAGYNNVVDLYVFDGAIVFDNVISVNTSTGVEGKGTAYTIQATGPYSGLVIDSNTLTVEGKGPALGIYSQNYAGPTNLTVSNNLIEVTGYATSSVYALVSGMELQDSVASVQGNVIKTKNVNKYNESNCIYGISYCQGKTTNHVYNITDNYIETEGNYAIYVNNVENTTVTKNEVYAHDAEGDDAVFVNGTNSVGENNYPPFDALIIIDSPAVWTGNNGNITVYIYNATGNVTIKIGNKAYENLVLANNTVSQVINAAELVNGSNAFEVIYSGDDNNRPGTETGNLEVLSGVVTPDTFKYYFDEIYGNFLSDIVPEGATLDFQGTFISDKYSVNINKPVNVISSTGDALFDSNTTNREWIYFKVVDDANHTNITGINFLNVNIFVEAPYVTMDDVTAIANMSGVGQSNGFVSFRTNAAYGTIKNSYFENGGSGSSIIVAGYGAPNFTIDNNIINVTGSSGNLIGANAYVGKGVTPGNMTITNNQIFNEQASTSTSYAVTLMGSYNVVENNTIKHKGSGIVNANIQWTTGAKDPMENNTYRNNVLVGCGISAAPRSIVEDNNMTAALALTGANIIATGNTAGSMTVGTTSAGGNITVDNNTIKGAVTINSKAVNTTFTNNYLKDALTVNSNGNNITDNKISTEKDYAIDLKTTSNNTVKFNTLSSKDKMGDDAVKFAESKDNNVTANGANAIIQIEAANSWSGNNNTINITVVNATGNVTVRVNGKEFDPVVLKDSKATFEIPANVIEVGLNDLTVTYNGSKLISAESKDATFYGLDNVVFTEVFFDYFGADGILKSDVPYTDLIFKGAFAKASTVKYIVIDKPLNITGEDASLSLIGIEVKSDNVMIDGLKFSSTVNSATSSLGNLIYVNGDNVTLSNLDITFKVTNGEYDSVAINASNSDNLVIVDSKIVLSSVIKSDDYHASALNLEGVTNALIDNNTISTTLPAATVNYDNADEDYFLMGTNMIDPIRMKEVVNSTFSNNIIDSKINNIYKKGSIDPTAQSVFIIGCENLLLDSNSFTFIDTKSKEGTVTYVYAITFGYNKNLTVLDNDFEISTSSGKDASGTAYALQGVESEIYIIGNSITSTSNGPNLGIYVASMMGGSSEVYIEDNYINVTGNATSDDPWALVSGIEITNGNARIYNNTINVNNKAGFVEEAPVYGVSCWQWMYGDRSLDVQDNVIMVNGNYTVAVLEGTPCNVTENTLYAEELFGDDSVAPGYDGIVENNTPPFKPNIIIDAQAVWIGSNSTISVLVPGATGNVTIVIGNKTYKEVPLENETVTVDVAAADLVAGSNNVTVTYNGDLYIKKGTEVGNLEVLYGVITNETYKYFFDEDGYLLDYVPNGTTLDFQGLFLGKYPVYIDKSVNVISSTGDALFDAGATFAGNAINSFNIIAGGNNTNITDLEFINYCLYIKGASNVTVDGIYMNANMRGVGSGTGFISIHSEAYYTTVKNSYFENGGTGSSCLVLGKGGKYATFDNNYFNITGSSGNVLSSNVFVGVGELPQAVNYTNNIIESHVAGSSFMYGITVCGEGNIIENNTLLNFKGNAIINQFGATSTKNIYRGNVITGGGSMQIGTYSLVEKNILAESPLTVTEGCVFTENIAKSVTISGKDVVASSNLIEDGVTISTAAKNTTFTFNAVNGTVVVESNDNIITDNVIRSALEYAVDLKTTANNTVTDNVLYGSELVGDNAVNFVEDKNNTVEDNLPIGNVLVVSAENIKVGENATIEITFEEDVVLGLVTVIVDAKVYEVPIIASKGQLTVPGLTAGEYTVRAVFLGDLLYFPTENTTKFTVEKLETVANITTPVDFKIGEPANVTVSIPDATGNVSVIIDGVETSVPLENGTAVVTIPEVTGGEHSVVVVYDGDDIHAPLHNVTTFGAPEFPTEFKNITISGEGFIDGYLVDAFGDPIANATITYKVNGVEANTTTGAFGWFYFNATYPATVEIFYAGNDAILPSNLTLTLRDIAPTRVATSIVAKDLTQYAVDFKAGERGGYFNIQLVDQMGNPLANKAIKIGFNGVVYDRTTDSEGKARLQINLANANEVTFAVAFLGDNDYNGSFVVQKITILKKKTSISASAKSFKASAKKSYTVTLKTDKGSSVDGKVYLSAGKKLTMTINGKTYTAKTNSKGQATFKLSITKKGTFSSTVKFAGDNTYAASSKSVKITIK